MIGLLMFWQACKCGHLRSDHEHYRGHSNRAEECAVCECPRFRRYVWPTVPVWRRG